jgi:hypothetical protein
MAEEVKGPESRVAMGGEGGNHTSVRGVLGLAPLAAEGGKLQHAQSAAAAQSHTPAWGSGQAHMREAPTAVLANNTGLETMGGGWRGGVNLAADGSAENLAADGCAEQFLPVC